MDPFIPSHVRVGPRWSRRRGLAGWVALAVCFFLVLIGRGTGAPNTGFSEQEIKAAWLFNFARFVEWPTNSFATQTAPIVVGVVGKDPFGKELEKALVGRTIRGRPVLLKRGLAESDLANCHLLFISPSERRRLRDLPEKLRGAPVLTVGETDEFLDQGGIINFVIKENAVRFEINVRPAQRAGLKLDANLLKVAVSVRGRYE